jgi:hypothetical protein
MRIFKTMVVAVIVAAVPASGAWAQNLPSFFPATCRAAYKVMDACMQDVIDFGTRRGNNSAEFQKLRDNAAMLRQAYSNMTPEQYRAAEQRARNEAGMDGEFARASDEPVCDLIAYAGYVHIRTMRIADAELAMFSRGSRGSVFVFHPG